MPLLPNLTNWNKPGVLWPRGDHLQEPVDAIRTLANNVGLIEDAAQVVFSTQPILAVLTGKGPSNDGKSGADDLKGCQYWAKFQIVQGSSSGGGGSGSSTKPSSGTDDPITLIDDTTQNDQAQANGSIGNGQPTIVSATNLAEYVFRDIDKAIGSHLLNTDDTQVVMLWAYWDSGPPTNSHIHYLFFCPVVGFWARITNATGIDPTNSTFSPFMYDWIKQKESLDLSTGLVTLVDTDPIVSGHYTDNPKSGAYNAWELPGNTGYTAVPSPTIVKIEVTYAYSSDKTKAPIPVLRFHFPTIDECSNPPVSP